MVIEQTPSSPPVARLKRLGHRCWPLLAYALIVILYVGLVQSHLGFFAWHDDESVFLLTAKAVNDGQALYRDVWFNYPPGYVQYLVAAFRLFGYGLTTARLAVMLTGLIGIAAVAAIAHHLRGATAGVLAALLLATVPHYVVLSGAVMTEVPAVALATVGALLALIYAQRGRLGWLLGSGVALALGMLVKPTIWPAFVVPGIAIVIVARRPGRIVLQGLAFSAAVLLPVAADILLSHPAEFVHQLVITFSHSREAFPLDLGDNVRHLAQYIFWDKYELTHVSLLALAVVGLVALWRERRPAAWMLGAWLIVSLLALLLHTPMYRHHQVVLLLPLSALAGVGLVALWPVWRAQSRKGTRFLIGALLVLFVVELRGSAWASLATIEQFEADSLEISQQAVDWVSQNTTPDDTILTDGDMIAVRAEREVPVATINTSRMRIYTGELTDEQLIQTARTYDPAAIIFWEKKLASADDFSAWVICQYDLAEDYDERHRIFTPRPTLQFPKDMVTLDQSFGDAFLLHGYTLDRATDGATAELTLYWEATAKIAADYKVFVHVLGTDGTMVTQDDARPRQWLCPTWVWQPGERIEDLHTLDMSGAEPGAELELQVGLYDAVTGERPLPGSISIVLPGANTEE